MLHPNFLIAGTVISALGHISYLIFTLQGKIKPNKVSYGMWALAPLIAFAAEISQGVGLHSLLTFSVGFWPLIIFIASFVNKNAYWKLTKFDLACGAFSLIGLFLWGITKVGNIAILFSIIADGLAALPTIIKSYHHPKTESPWIYLSSVTFAIITLLTIKIWKFAYFGFPVYILLVNLTVLSAIYGKLRLGSR